MAYVFRIAILFVFAHTAFADYPARPTYTAKFGANSYVGIADNPLEAATKSGALYSIAVGRPACGAYYPSVLSGTGSFDIHNMTGAVPPACELVTGNRAMTGVLLGCPYGGVLTGSTCVGANAPVVCPSTGTPVPGGDQTFIGTGGSYVACNSGCSISCSGTVCVGSKTSPGGGSTSGSWINTGVACSGNASTPSICPEGQVSGTFNGLPICLPVGVPTDVKTEGTKNTTVTNPDGSSTTTTTTTSNTCTGAGSCSTNTTITTKTFAPGVSPATGTPASTSVESKTEDQPQKTYCEENPSAEACKKLESQFGGSCSGFTCKGDAVQCAIAAEQHKRNCSLFDTQTSLSVFGNKVGSGIEDVDGASLSTAAGRTGVNLAGSFDTSKRFSGTLSDLTIPLFQGQSLSIPFSRLNPFLGFMGSIVVAFSMLSGARIVGVI